MTSGRPGPSGDEARRLDNQISGGVLGDAFQAGDISGGVHFTTNNYFGMPAASAPLPPPFTPPVSPPITPRPAPATPASVPLAKSSRRPRKWPRVVGEWLLSFVPIFAVSIVPGFIAVAVVGDESIGARLADLVIGLVLVGVIGLVWWLVTRRRGQQSPRMFVLASLDRLAFKRLGTVSVPGLVCILGIFGGATITGLVQQPQPNSDGGLSGTACAVVFCVLVVLVAARRLQRRS